ncbi:hypothetical protein [Bradyrhizobium sp. SRL28]|nr:hypothetical protein [Bradyrhizobium sp. SRL28]
MDQSDDPRELARKIEQAARIASRDLEFWLQAEREISERHGE